MTSRARRRTALAAGLLIVAACSGGGGNTVALQPWDGATALSASEDTPVGVVSDGVNVFFTTGRTLAGEQAIRAAPLQPAEPAASRVLVAKPGGKIPNGRMVVSGADLYVAAGGGIVRVAIATGEATVVVDGRPAEVTSLAIDDRYLWWTTATYLVPAASEVARMPRGGGPVEIVAAGVDEKGAVFLRDEAARRAVATPVVSSVGSIVLDGGSDGGGGGALVATPSGVHRIAAGRAPQLVVSADALGGAPTRIAADGQRVYGVIAGGKGNLFAVPKAGGSPLELAAKANNTKDIAVADGEVYYFTDGALNAVPVGGGAARVLASGTHAAGDVAVVGDRVVFSAARRVWSAYRQRP